MERSDTAHPELRMLGGIQRAAFNYFLHETNARNGLVVDSTDVHAPASIAAVGFGLTGYPAAVERGFISRADAARRSLATLRFFWQSRQGPEPDATGYRGFYYHYLDMHTGARAWKSEISTVDSAFLVGGMLAVGAYFDDDQPIEREIRELADQLYTRIDWQWAMNGGDTVTHGWHPESGFLPYRWEGYDEAMLLYVLALGSPTHPLPAASYTARTAAYQWRTVCGWDLLHAGPLFVHQLSHMWIDFRGIQDSFMRAHHSDYFENTRRASMAQQQYAIRNPSGFARYGDRCWGITASEGPGDRSCEVAMADALASRPRRELVDQAEQMLLKGVETQLAADVPVGAFCSGGVDSSLILAMAARHHADLRVYHADVVGPLSERSAAEHLCRHLKLDLQAVPVLDRHFVETIADVVHHYGFPCAIPTAVPLLMVSQLVRENNIKAVLCGEGSDECFLGYSWLSRDLRATLAGLPRKVVRGLIRARAENPASSANDSDLVSDIVNGFERQYGPPAFGECADGETRIPVSRGLASDSRLSYLLRSLLLRNDAMGMAASVEARFPFLDTRLVKFSVNLPGDCKVRFSLRAIDGKHVFYRDKWIIREVAARYMPRGLSARAKGQFPTDAFARMRIADRLFEAGFAGDLLGLTADRFAFFLRSASPRLRVRLMLLQSWWLVCILGVERDAVRANLVEHVTVSG